MYLFRSQFDETVEVLCSKLEELDKMVANSVADQVADVYATPVAPIEDLVKGAVTSSSPVDEYDVRESARRDEKRK